MGRRHGGSTHRSRASSLPTSLETAIACANTPSIFAPYVTICLIHQRQITARGAPVRIVQFSTRTSMQHSIGVDTTQHSDRPGAHQHRVPIRNTGACCRRDQVAPMISPHPRLRAGMESGRADELHRCRRNSPNRCDFRLRWIRGSLVFRLGTRVLVGLSGLGFTPCADVFLLTRGHWTLSPYGIEYRRCRRPQPTGATGIQRTLGKGEPRVLSRNTSRSSTVGLGRKMSSRIRC